MQIATNGSRKGGHQPNSFRDHTESTAGNLGGAGDSSDL